MNKTLLTKETRKAVEKYCEKQWGKYLTSSLGGHCAVASVALCNVFNHYGYKSTLVGRDFKEDRKDYGHYWVKYGKRYFDLTATQFGIKHRVYVHRIANPKDKIHKDGEEIKDLSRVDYFAAWKQRVKWDIQKIGKEIAQEVIERKQS
jgi:hypothetical protein